MSVDRDGSISTVTRYRLGGPVIESVGGRGAAKVSTLIQNVPAAHPVFYKMDSLPWVQLRDVPLTTQPHLARKLKKQYGYTVAATLVLTACSRETFTIALLQDGRLIQVG